MNLLRFHYRHIPETSAGILLMLLLACASTLTANALTTQEKQSGTEIVFDAQLQVSDELWPALFHSLRVDLAVGGDESPNGVVLDQNPALVLHKDLVPETAFGRILPVTQWAARLGEDGFRTHPALYLDRLHTIGSITRPGGFQP
jgi:hypothetical protein